MEKKDLVERAKLYLKLLLEGIHPVTGAEMPGDSAFVDEKVKRCFDFIGGVLDEYLVLSEKVERLEREREENAIVVLEKQEFFITAEQCGNVRLTKEPISVLNFAKNINAVIDADTTKKLTSTRLTKWLLNRGLLSADKVETVVNKTVYKPSELAERIGIVEEETVDRKSGELKAQIKLSQSAQLFILENIEEIVETT